MVVSPSGQRALLSRNENNDGHNYTAESGPGKITLPFWVKLERKGAFVTGYYSGDGVDWVKQPDTEDTLYYHGPNPRKVPMPNTVCIGLALIPSIFSPK